MFLLLGNAGLRSHFPAQFEPMEDRGGRQIEEEEEDGGEGNDRMAASPQEQAGVSVEVQIGRKLREIGDQFHQEHVEMVNLTSASASTLRACMHFEAKVTNRLFFFGCFMLSVTETC